MEELKDNWIKVISKGTQPYGWENMKKYEFKLDYEQVVICIIPRKLYYQNVSIWIKLLGISSSSISASLSEKNLQYRLLSNKNIKLLNKLLKLERLKNR